MEFKTDTEVINELRNMTKRETIPQDKLDTYREAIDEYQKLPEELQKHERVLSAYKMLKELVEEHVNDDGEITVPAFWCYHLDRVERIMDTADQCYIQYLIDAREGKRLLSRASETTVKPTETATTVKHAETATTAKHTETATAVKPTETVTA